MARGTGSVALEAGARATLENGVQSYTHSASEGLPQVTSCLAASHRGASGVDEVSKMLRRLFG